MDGRPDEPAWRVAAPVTDFTQSFPDRGAAPTERTEVRILFDESNIYFGFRCFQDPGSVARQVSRRDRYPTSDYVAVMLDGHRDRRSAFRFRAFASGTVGDESLYDDYYFDADWDAVWESAVAPASDGWTCEIRVPLNQIRFPRAQENTFGLQIRRYIVAKNETDAWVYVPPDVVGEVSRYGDLKGMQGLQPGLHLELLPYATTRHRRPAAQPGVTAEPRTEARAGLDVKYGISNNMTLDATVNPDFGQVELDNVVLNLSRFETFYSEKRPFFLEGASHLSFPNNVFYSRRIGRAPPLPYPPPGGRVVRAPDAATILCALKLTGKTAGGTGVGLLAAETREENATLEAADGTVYGQEVAPQTLHMVGRLTRDLPGGSTAGGVLTHARRWDGRRSTASGLDWNLRFGEQRWRFRGGWLGTANETLPAPPVWGSGANATLAREGGEHWSGYVSAGGMGPTLDYNPLGFMRRNNTRDASAGLGYAQKRRQGIFQNYNTGADVGYAETFEGRVLERYGNVWGFAQLTTFWRINAGAGASPGGFDDLETSGGIPIYRGRSTWAWANLGSDSRKRLYGWWTVNVSGQSPGVSESVYAGLTLRATESFEVSLNPSVSRTRGTYRYLAGQVPGAPPYLFAEQLLRECNWTLAALWAATPRLTLQGNAQLLLASVDYGARRELVDPFSLVETDASKTSALDPKFTFGSLVGNVILRWEWRPGSTVYFVYARTQSYYAGEGRLAPGPDARALSKAPSDDVLALKATFWWGR